MDVICCDAAYHARDQLLQHLHDKHNHQLIACPKKGCTWSTDNGDEMAKHALVHLDPPRTLCPEPGCNKSFSVADSLSKHIKQHTAPKFPCDYCNAEFGVSRRGTIISSDMLGALVVRRFSSPRLPILRNIEPSALTTATLCTLQITASCSQYTAAGFMKSVPTLRECEPTSSVHMSMLTLSAYCARWCSQSCILVQQLISKIISSAARMLHL